MTVVQMHVKLEIPAGENEDAIKTRMYTWIKKFFAATDKDQDGKLDCTDVVKMLSQNATIYNHIDINLALLLKQMEKRDKVRIELGYEREMLESVDV